MNYKSRMSYLEIEPVHERNWKEEKNVLVWICERDKIWKKAQNKHDKIQREKKGKRKDTVTLQTCQQQKDTDLF